MSSKQPFKRHRFPSVIILCAVRMYLRYPLSYQDVTDLLAERGLDVDRSTVFRWVQKFGPELSRRAERHLRRASLNWHVDETYIRVGGKWRYLWRAIDANGQLVDFRLTARRDAKAAKAFLNKAIERVRLNHPLSICTDKAPTYRKVIREINHRYDPHFDYITHVDRKYLNKPCGKRPCCSEEAARIPPKLPIFAMCKGDAAWNGSNQNEQEWAHTNEATGCTRQKQT